MLFDALGIRRVLRRSRLVRREFQRPRSQQRLIEVIFIRAIRCLSAIDIAFVTTIEAFETQQRTAPYGSQLREYVEPGANILAAFGIMRGTRGQRVRTYLCPLAHTLMKRLRRHPETARIAAHLIQREQTNVPIERGILNRLCEHRRGVLLEFHRQANNLTAHVARTLPLHRIGREDRSDEIVDRIVRFEAVSPCHGYRPLDIAAILR